MVMTFQQPNQKRKKLPSPKMIIITIIMAIVDEEVNEILRGRRETICIIEKISFKNKIPPYRLNSNDMRYVESNFQSCVAHLEIMF
jgi:hypothetical protein